MYKKPRHAEYILACRASTAIGLISSSVGLNPAKVVINRQAILAKALPGVFAALCDDTAAFHFGTRRDLEDNVDFLQPVHYITFYKDCEDGQRRYWAYRRTSKIGEDKLAGNASVGWGGHPELTDLVLHHDDHMEPMPVPNILATLAKAATREMAEEVRFISKLPGGDEGLNTINLAGLSPTYFILDRSNPVGSVHLALSTLIPLMPDTEHRVGEPDEHIDQGLLTAEELLSGDYPLENWTRLVLMAEVAKMTGTNHVLHWEDAPVKVQNSNVSGKHAVTLETVIRMPDRFVERDGIITQKENGASMRELSSLAGLDPWVNAGHSRTSMRKDHPLDPLLAGDTQAK